MKKRGKLQQNSSAIILRSFTSLIIIIILLSSISTVVAIGHQLLETSQINSANIISSLKKTVIDGDDDWKAWRINSTLDTSTSYVHVINMRTDAKRKNYYSPDTDDLLESKRNKIPFVHNLYYSGHTGFLYYESGHARGIKYELWTKLDNQLEILERVIIVTIIILILTLLISPLYVRLIANRLTEALESLTSSADNISSNSTMGIREEIKLPVPEKPTEVTNLAVSFNRLLKQLYQQTEAEKSFVSNAAHELRTPIATIRSHAQLIQRRGKKHPEVIERSVGYINEESHQMQTLVEELLTLSRADRLVYNLELYDISTNLNNLINKVTPVLEQQIVTNIPDNIKIKANKESIEKIISSFISNAGKYSPPHSTISLTLKQNGNHTTIAVADEGTGISPDDRQHLFERFYRSSDVRGITSGTGLGLAIAKQLADLNNATIAVTDNVPHGSIFTLIFK